MEKLDSWNMTPKWMRISFYLLKWLMVMIPFVVSSIALFWEPEMSIMDSGLWNCLWMMSMLNIINMSNEEI